MCMDQAQSQVQVLQIKWIGSLVEGYFLSITITCIQDMLLELPLKVTQGRHDLHSEVILLHDSQTFSFLIPSGFFYKEKDIIKGRAILSVGTIFTKVIIIPPLCTALPNLKMRDLLLENGMIYGKIKLVQSVGMCGEARLAITQNSYIALYTYSAPLAAGEEVAFSFSAFEVDLSSKLILMINSRVIDEVAIPPEKKEPLSLKYLDKSKFSFDASMNTQGQFVLSIKWLGSDMVFPVAVELENSMTGKQMFYSVFIKAHQTEVIEYEGVNPDEWIFVRIGEEVLYFVEALPFVHAMFV